jgi:hypothetical protein
MLLSNLVERYPYFLAVTQQPFRDVAHPPGIASAGIRI